MMPYTLKILSAEFKNEIKPDKNMNRIGKVVSGKKANLFFPSSITW